MFKLLLIIVLMATPMAHALSPVDQVNPEAYEGKWHEVALIPYFFEKHCSQDSFVRYTLLSDESDKQPVFEDYFQCQVKEGAIKTLTGRAKVVDTNSNAILSATFLKLFGWRYWFGQNYWIIGVDPDYQYAVVGQPGLKHGWVFSRNPALTDTQWQAVAQVLKRNGYDLCKFVTVPQEMGLQVKQPLCQLLEPSNQ